MSVGGSILEQNLRVALDLLEYKFEIATTLGLEEPTAEGRKIGVFFDDFRKVNISGDDLYEALFYLAGKFAEIKVVQIYDVVNAESPWDGDVGDRYTPQFAEIVLPLDFEIEVQRFRRQLGIKSSEQKGIDSDIRVGDLIYQNGEVRHKGRPIRMRAQILKLCRLLMEKHPHVVDLEGTHFFALKV